VHAPALGKLSILELNLHPTHDAVSLDLKVWKLSESCDFMERIISYRSDSNAKSDRPVLKKNVMRSTTSTVCPIRRHGCVFKATAETVQYPFDGRHVMEVFHQDTENPI
jgi:hypothetical protein